MAYFGFDAYDVDSGKDPFVFISYKSDDSKRVAPYARHLHNKGINVWYDNGIHPGVDWESYLMSIIEKDNCKAVLLFITANVKNSTVIPLETTRARQCDKPTVAVFLEPGLDLEEILNKAIKVYVEQRQSVNAYKLSEKEAFEAVLTAAKKAMKEIDDTPKEKDSWDIVQLFLTNAKRSKSESDVAKAKKWATEMTEKDPTDYRGWLGLALCNLVLPVSNIDSALSRLKKASKYYSYVISNGDDINATPEYTIYKSEFWRSLLTVIENDMNKCTTEKDMEALKNRVLSLSNYMGHTYPNIRERYNEILALFANTDTVIKQNHSNTAASSTAKAHQSSKPFKIIAFILVVLLGIGLWQGLSSQWQSTDKNNKAPQSSTVQSNKVESNPQNDIPQTANSDETASDEVIAGLKYEIVNNSVTITRYTGDEITLAIPDEIEGKRVTAIEKRAFKNCDKLTEITIPGSVTAIGDSAFYYCSKLNGINIPNGVKSIENYTFKGCSGLTELTIPNGVTSVGTYAFLDCTGLTEITLPDSVTDIGMYAFCNCTGLKKITLSSSINSIGYATFKNCTDLTEITIPGSVTSISVAAFQNCNVTVYAPHEASYYGEASYEGVNKWVVI